MNIGITIHTKYCDIAIYQFALHIIVHELGAKILAVGTILLNKVHVIFEELCISVVRKYMIALIMCL